MISNELLKIIVCPDTMQELELAEHKVVEKINGLIDKGVLKNRAGQVVVGKIEAGLIQKDSREYLYPVREDIPAMLIEESIPLSFVL